MKNIKSRERPCCICLLHITCFFATWWHLGAIFLTTALVPNPNGRLEEDDICCGGTPPPGPPGLCLPAEDGRAPRLLGCLQQESYSPVSGQGRREGEYTHTRGDDQVCIVDGCDWQLFEGISNVIKHVSYCGNLGMAKQYSAMHIR